MEIWIQSFGTKKKCVVFSSDQECYPFHLSKKKCGIWPGSGVWVSAPVDSTQGGTEPLLSLSCGQTGIPVLGTEVVAGVSLCWKSCPTLWCLPGFQVSIDSLATQPTGQWALMGLWMLVIFGIKRCSCVGFWVLCVSNQTQHLTRFLWWTSV